MNQQMDCMYGKLSSRMWFIYNCETSTLTPFVKPRSILNLAVWNIFNIQSALRAIQKLFYCKVPQKHMIISKKSPKMTKKSLPTICLIAYMESTIIYNPGQPIEWFHQRETCGCAKYIHNFWSSHTVWSICLMVQ